MVKRLKEKIKNIIHMGENPRDISLAVALGVFIAFFPIMGTHTLLALGSSWALGVNPAITLFATFVNNPWTIAFLYGGSLWVGFILLRMELSLLHGINWIGMDVSTFIKVMKTFALPFVVGCLFVGAIAAIITYFATHKTIVLYLARHKERIRKMEEPG